MNAETLRAKARGVVGALVDPDLMMTDQQSPQREGDEEMTTTNRTMLTIGGYTFAVEPAEASKTLYNLYWTGSLDEQLRTWLFLGAHPSLDAANKIACGFVARRYSELARP